ncbi:mitochondrial 54S ribosomal protein YmL38/YmL34 [Piedraia hortae CBS 480.64]|uniref:Large ribosomal subunit protein uL14m n=1 Tax=Piedraia hortae CBS 480.64 TaxID=1314780 RepID=A0A6A7C4P1_9PEZI|nr:mitochondrial 54S ribosomal protein YmL38/YmL34 [Piedraia hortae CBS 480.64]
MINLKTLLNVIDNSGAAVAECIQLLHRPQKKSCAKIGDRIVIVVQKARKLGGGANASSLAQNKVQVGDIRHAVIVRTKKEVRRSDGSYARFGDNACVLLNKSGEPIGSRLNGVVGRELRDKGRGRVLSLARDVW